MASTYSFNCIIHYNFNDSDIKFSDSTALYSTSETINITTNKATGVETVELPLPDYLQGIEDGITWYSDTEATEHLVSEKTPVNWTLSKKITIGNFISYTAEVTLYTKCGSKTINWKYLNSTTPTIEDKVESITVSTTTWQAVPSSVPQKQEGESDSDFTKRQEKYKKDFLNFINTNAPKIPAWVIGKAKNSTSDDDPVYLFTFKEWDSLKLDLLTGIYSCEANYNSTEYSDTNRYTTNKTNIFEEAEPYHYDSGSPADGYFLPIGEDNDDRTEDIKIQAPETNGYSTIKKLSGYKIKDKDLTYIEKGTFPLTRLIKSYSNKYVANTHNSSNTNDTPNTGNGERDKHHCFCYLAVEYGNGSDGDGHAIIKKIILGYDHTDTDTDTAVSLDIAKVSDRMAKKADGTGYNYSFDDSLVIYEKKASDSGEANDRSKDTKNFKAHADELYPKRLGFVLVGGGGGSGGMSQIDPDKNKSGGDQYLTPGGGGGGGEIVYGALNLEHPTLNSAGWSGVGDTQNIEILVFVAYLGCGGRGGAHGSTSASHNNPQYGESGYAGWNSRLWVVPNADTSHTGTKELFHAQKGSGGGSGGLSTAGGGGAGGAGGTTCEELKKNPGYRNCYICGRISGGDGGPTGDSPANKAFSHNIYFSNAVPPSNNAAYCISLDYPATNGNSSNGTNRSEMNVPGGHSFGPGSHKTQLPSNGAGGCCKEYGGRDGCGGYFGIYY